jgi:hypothetical protein
VDPPVDLQEGSDRHQTRGAEGSPTEDRNDRDGDLSHGGPEIASLMSLGCMGMNRRTRSGGGRSA